MILHIDTVHTLVGYATGKVCVKGDHLWGRGQNPLFHAGNLCWPRANTLFCIGWLKVSWTLYGAGQTNNVCCCISVVFSSPCRSALDLEYSIHSSPRHSWKCMGTFLSSSSRWDHLQKTEFIWKSDHQCLALLRICSVRPYEDLANLMTPFNLWQQR